MNIATNTNTPNKALRDALSVGLYSVGIGAGAFAGFVALLLAA